MLCGSLVLNVEESLSRMGDLFIRSSRYLPSATTSYMLCGLLIPNVEESLSEWAIF
jgi:hypothetical protein